MTKVAVFSAGSWGTAFSLVLADAGNDVTIWGRRAEVCAARVRLGVPPRPGRRAGRERP